MNIWKVFSLVSYWYSWQWDATTHPPEWSKLKCLRTAKGFPAGSDGKESACNAGDLGSVPGLGRPLEEEMATYSSILAWRIPRTEEPGRLQSIRLDTSEQLTQRKGNVGGRVDPKELSNTAVPVQASETILENNLLGIRSNTWIFCKPITCLLLIFKSDHSCG